MKWLSKFFRMFPLFVLMLPVPARGELVLSFFGCAAMGANLHFDGAKTFYQKPSIESSADGDFQDRALGICATYWLARNSWLGFFGFGVNADFPAAAAVHVGGATMSWTHFECFLLFRLPQGFPFLHGRIVPYAGIGASVLTLDGEAVIFSGTKEDYHVDDARGFFGKIGFEWVVTGPLAVFLEARYYGPVSFTFDRTDNTYWDWIPWWCPVIPVLVGEDATHLDAQLGQRAQVCLGIAWHF